MEDPRIIFHPTQSLVASSRNRFRVVCSGRRWGKTILSVYEMLGKAIGANDRNVCYIAPTYQQARDLAWVPLKTIGANAIQSVNESRLEIKIRTVRGGSSRIILRGWESIETLRGQAFHFIVIDEIAMMRNWLMNWQEVIRPTLTDYRGEVLFISTPKGFNHFYDLFNAEATDSDYRSFHFTSYDNPFMPKDELDKAKSEMSDTRFHQEYMADFRKMEGLVYPEFDRNVHVYGEMEEKRVNGIETLVGIDFGYTNPCAILTVLRDRDERYFVINEYYKTGLTNDEIVEYARAIRANNYYPDPAEPDRIEEMRRAGCNCRDVIKDVPKGIDAVRTMFKTNRLFIHQRCENLINELEMYQYREEKPDLNAPEEPVKDHDHAVDALRYLISMRAGFISSPGAQRRQRSFSGRVTTY
ncbi:hypothetical protein GF380_05760 [Candidatus Uhrbacteria bacterium]|nr:hypothetical protein [Candidatus Uhrbacteria bacterium]